MEDQRELLKEILAEVRAEREADIEASVKYTKLFRDLWDKEVGKRPDKRWYTTLKTLYAKGLSETELYDAVMVAASSTPAGAREYIYFCGIANTKLRQIEDAALGRLEAMTGADLDLNS